MLLPLFGLLKHFCSSHSSRVILHAHYVLVHTINVHQCTLDFRRWFRWTWQPKIPLFWPLKHLCSFNSLKVLLRACYVLVLHVVNVHRCTLASRRFFGWNQHQITFLLTPQTSLYLDWFKSYVACTLAHERALEAKACTNCVHRHFRHLASS